MGDRNNPIKFGPEWLRNMPRERSAARSTNSQNANTSPAGAASANPSGAAASPTSNASVTPSNTNITSKVLLAKLRYGREEMLALYDRNSEAPAELKYIDTLYQPRGKQPVALNSTFEDDARDNLRSAPPIGGMAMADRFGIGRGIGRGVISDGRGRPRGSYVRQPSIGRGTNWHVGSPRLPYSGGADEDNGSPRPWTSNNMNSTNRSSGDQTDWMAAKMAFRNKRPGTNTNWRQPTREDGEEWRSSDPGRRNLEKWDREWGERPSGDKPQSWNTNRRGWGGDSQNEENLPEWAGENAECGGTFDSSGAFHGYSNDDTNLPKHQDSSYPLTRSHTHGSFPRPKALEEGSEEWWASEKAKKLSPKRFDASDLKFKKQPGIGIAELPNATGITKQSSSKEEQPQEASEKEDQQTTTTEPPEASATHKGEDSFSASNQNAYKSNKFTESKTFDALMRSDIDLEESSDERSNFQSVIINSNNSLRQKHQFLGAKMKEVQNNNKQPQQQQQTQQQKTAKKTQNELDHVPHKSPEDLLLVDNIFGMSLDDKEILSTSSSNSLMNSGISSALASAANALPQNPSMQMSMSSSTISSHGMSMEMHLAKQSSVIQPGHPGSGMPPGVLNSVGMPTGMQPGMPSSMQAGLQMPGMPGMPGLPNSMPTPGMQSSFPSMAMQSPGMSSERMQNMSSGGMQNMSSGGMQNISGGMQNMPSSMSAPRVQTPGMQPLQNVGITNSALNASLGLPIGPNIGMPMQGIPQQVMPNVCMANNSSMGGSAMSVMGSASMQGSGNIPGFQSSNSIQGMSSNVGNASLFLQNSSNPALSSSMDMPISNHGGQNNLMHLHGLQQQLSGSQPAFGNSIYSNSGNNLAEQWYYEDPERNIQGPFSSKDMYNWYRAGFFSPSLMVRRACETMMRPLGTYGPVVPFIQHDSMMSGFPMSGGFERSQSENILGNQSSLALDVMNMANMNMTDNTPMETLQFGSVNIMTNQSYRQPQQMDALWGQPSSTGDLMWMQQPLTRAETRVNNLPIYFWDQQPTAINSLPEEIAKEMKTEDQILAQLRATQNIPRPPSQPFMSELPSSTSAATADDHFAAAVNATPNLEELHKLIQTETLTGNNNVTETENIEQAKTEKSPKPDQSETNLTKSSSQTKTVVDTKQTKQPKEADKSTKNKENNNTKNKSKKAKDDKKEEVAELKTKEEEVIKAEKRSQESSPSKTKKEDKASKKDLDKEKKEWIKEGFTIVKGSEKSANKDNKKKAEEARVAEEAERKRKEEEKLAAEEEKKKKQVEQTVKKQQEQQAQQQRQASESVVKKAPWSAVANQAMSATNREGLTLAEIQRLEREKKLEQMKEQQQMMQIIAQQQAAALAREQEMQAGLGWAKKKGSNQTQGQSLAEIQAEARKQAVAAAVAAAAKAMEEAEVVPPPQTNHAPWASTHNGGATVPRGFWDTQPKAEKQELQKTTEPTKNKKKLTLATASKKDTSPAVEFESWCTTILASWSSKIDVPTFVGFLKDIESPYEVKDYVKCYLGESKDSSDFARQFLERRSKLLRVGMVTPSDDLCSPAIAVNPRTISGSDYQEVKGKGKKTKKNKMLKVDARILGFSVTASEDRINVGDIDTV